MTHVPEPTPLSPAQDQQWGAFAHFGGLIGIIPSLLIFLILKDRGAITGRESKVALNWQITFTLAFIALQIVTVILNGVFVAAGVYAVLPFLPLLIFALWVVNAVFCIQGGLKVLAGGEYTYPWSLNLIK